MKNRRNKRGCIIIILILLTLISVLVTLRQSENRPLIIHGYVYVENLTEVESRHGNKLINKTSYVINVGQSNSTVLMKGVDFKPAALNHGIFGSLQEVLVDKLDMKTSRHFPIVMGASFDHYGEALTTLLNILQIKINRTVYFYDLGLTDYQRGQVGHRHLIYVWIFVSVIYIYNICVDICINDIHYLGDLHI